MTQLDEPWLQARAEEARRLALPAIDKALHEIPGPTALHLCFGYARVARDKPNRYTFLPELVRGSPPGGRDLLGITSRGTPLSDQQNLLSVP